MRCGQLWRRVVKRLAWAVCLDEERGHLSHPKAIQKRHSSLKTESTYLNNIHGYSRRVDERPIEPFLRALSLLGSLVTNETEATRGTVRSTHELDVGEGTAWTIGGFEIFTQAVLGKVGWEIFDNQPGHSAVMKIDEGRVEDGLQRERREMESERAKKCAMYIGDSSADVKCRRLSPRLEGRASSSRLPSILDLSPSISWSIEND